MKSIKINSNGSEVLLLQQLLNKKGYKVAEDGDFGAKTQKAVMSFQKDFGLVADGVVGDKTWSVILGKETPYFYLSEEDFQECADLLNVDVAAIKAVQEVETGSNGGFFQEGKPSILFEGHIFWNQLIKVGKNPQDYLVGNDDILYKSWTKTHYKGGLAEYDRLNKAMQIDREAALSSASWGMFQIMGFNYSDCNCSNINIFVDRMKQSAKSQLKLFTYFMLNHGYDKYLRNKNWDGFAKRYNGPGYALNQYDVKLANAYLKYSK